MTTPHLDEEALSAALDGAATAAEESHLASCADCQAQMASLAAVVHAVSSPVAPRPASEVDHAIAAALAAWPLSEKEPERVGWEPSGAMASGPVPVIRPSPWAEPEPAGRVTPGRSRSGGATRWLGAAAGIAAALIVLGGLVAVFRASHNVSSTSTSAGTTVARPFDGGLSSGQNPPGGARYATSGGYLGDQSDPSSLARQVTAALSQAATAAPSFGTTTVPAPETNTPLNGLPCVTQARSALGLPGTGDTTVRYSALLRWQGQPAEVLVFSRAGGLAGVVMKTADCSPLVVLPL